MSFTKTIRQNSASPKDGSSPLTVIEFSLTNEPKICLEQALRPYIEGNFNETTPSLKDIIEATVPKEILKELSILSAKGEPPSNIYVIKNLPELPPEDIKNGKYSDYFLKTRSYASLIGEGVGHAIDLQRQGTVLLKRTSVDSEILGSQAMHKHPDQVTGLAGIYLTEQAQPATRFTDMGTLSEDASLEATNLTVKTVESLRGMGAVTVSEFQKKWPLWKDRAEMKLLFKGDKEKLDELVAKHSQEVIVSPGDLVLWSNHGRIFHEALPAKETPYSEETITRIVLAQLFQKQIFCFLETD